MDGADVVVEFTTPKRPGCRFGFRYAGLPAAEVRANETPDMYATDARVNLEELIEAVGYGLPHDCSPDQILWLSFESLRQRDR